MSKVAVDGSNFQTNGEWRQFFDRFGAIVLVANSETQDPVSLRRRFPHDTLFIFFNKVYKVLDDTFGAPSLLVSRSGAMGANLVHRREVGDVLRFFPDANFLGILNIRTACEERFSPPSAFEGAMVYHADLQPLVSVGYPNSKIPTSGYALVVWLRDLQVRPGIHLSGFSGKRSDRWKVFDVHDWTFERAYFRLLAEQRLISLGETDQGLARFELLKTHFPELTNEQIQSALNEVFASRIDSALSHIDRLMSITKWQRKLDTLFRKARPRTRKQKFQDDKT